jgi:hypothetical protein
LDAAKQFFRIPTTNAVFNHALENIPDAVIKSLASEPFANSKVLYTTRVHLSQLKTNGNPWRAQAFIDSKSDVTTFIVGNEFFTFERQRKAGVTVDWRKEQLEDLQNKAWSLVELAQSTDRSIKAFAQSIDVSWGRIDFVKDHEDELWLLEYNANGQFGFLDEMNETGIFDAIANYLESS